MSPAAALEELALARQVADHAKRLGVCGSLIALRAPSDHLGAVLADTILQAGVSYRTVVRIRVERIQSQFPAAATLPGLLTLIEEEGPNEILLWNHPVKVSRFVTLTQFLAMEEVETTVELKHWLYGSNARERLLSLHGIGPKSCDYLSGLVGVDCIAVDRHIKAFVGEAGVPVGDYERVKSVVSCAADLLGLARRDFDGWIWRTISGRAIENSQPSLF